jgi:hypothetical protein
MFRKSDKYSQLNLYSTPSQFLTGASLNAYEDTAGWHNQFCIQVTQRIEEGLFRPLFSNGLGAPNSSIRVLVGMMILKEGQGLSDSKLFEECRFNLLTRRALGLFNLDDSLPTESTYYLLRKRIVDWEKAGNDNLIEKAFSQVTKSQAIEFQVNGKKLRMDSKLLGSNIAWYSRYELVHETLRKAYPVIQADQGALSLNAAEIDLLKSIMGESGDKVVYRSNKEEVESKMVVLGRLIYHIIRQQGEQPSEAMQTLCSVFHNQYQLAENENENDDDDDGNKAEKERCILPRAKEEISAKSIQSPHDTECHYRNKDGNQVKGYSINVTETCDEAQPLNLIANVLVDVVSTADCDFLQPAIEATVEVITQPIETINADGAYNSVPNQDYCKGEGIDLILSAIQGKPSQYDLSLDEAGELIVIDLQTNEIVPSRKIESRKNNDLPKWGIKNEKGKNRYFTQKEIDACLLRKQTAARTPAELNVRNNVEATIFQVGYHYPNDKSRYRGLSKHKIWANVRCLWINFVRIVNFIARSGSNCVQKAKSQLNIYQNLLNLLKFTLALCSVRNFYPAVPNNGRWTCSNSF